MQLQISSQWHLDHIGIAVRDLDGSTTHYREKLGAEILEREIVPTQNVEVQFLKLGGAVLELISSINDQGPIAKFLAKRGEGIHHLAYEVTDINKTLQVLGQSGIALIDSVSRPGSRKCQVAFLHPKSCGGVLIELCEPETP